MDPCQSHRVNRGRGWNLNRQPVPRVQDLKPSWTTCLKSGTAETKEQGQALKPTLPPSACPEQPGNCLISLTLLAFLSTQRGWGGEPPLSTRSSQRLVFLELLIRFLALSTVRGYLSLSLDHNAKNVCARGKVEAEKEHHSTATGHRQASRVQCKGTTKADASRQRTSRRGQGQGTTGV